ncbi:hypothetical protein E5676_scaffold66G00350 [Cucumis melo var. makuwa]|uniref:Uncharacterized protein n=1 Tax=Cucumis melo var. makuwa TaxID=1194695 RepID=A0A5D3CLN6_CUCMM|nr:hypothetical protein E5676_scaffold66G00350 [Cucumis melo var. makuwa]
MVIHLGLDVEALVQANLRYEKNMIILRCRWKSQVYCEALVKRIPGLGDGRILGLDEEW